MRWRFVSVLRSSLACVLAGALGGCPGSEPATTVDRSLVPSSVDLVRTLPEALSLAETRRIDFGTDLSHDYLVAGWVGDDVFADDGSTFAWSLGEGSTVQFVVLKPRELELRMRLRPYRIDGPPQQVRFLLNGEEVGSLQLKGGMREYRLKLPAAPMVRGRNLLRFCNIYPRNIGPGPPDLGPPGTAWDYLWIGDGEPPGMPEPRGDGIFLPFGTEVSYYLKLPAESYLTWDGLESDHRRGRLIVRSRLAGDDGERFERELRATATPRALPITAPEPTLTRVTLSALFAGSPPGPGRGLLIRQPAVRWRDATAAGVAPDRAAAPAAAPRRPHVIVYLVDTLRADHLGCYGYPKPISPRIDAFAADGVLFEQTMAQSSWTRTAVASLFTGRVPTAHGVRGRRDALAPDAVTLAEILRDAGYDTAAFVTNGNVGAACGLAQGFTTFELLGERDTMALHALSDEVNREVFSWLGQRRERSRPFFLYIHTMDPHAPYAPPEMAARRFAANVGQGELDAETIAALEATRKPTSRRWGSRASEARLGSVTWMQALDARRLRADRAMTEDLMALYDAEIFFNDRHFGALLDRLRATGLDESSVILLLSDHGEEFFDHRGWGHGRTLFHEQIRVPLIVRFPGADAPRGRRIRGLAQHVDLLPTLLDYLGLPPPAGIQGESLLPAVFGASDQRDPPSGYSYLELDGRFAESLVEGPWKLLCGDRLGVACTLYDLALDPRERRDVAARQPVFTGYLQSRMRGFRHPDDRLQAAAAELGPELLDRLEALGYLTPDPSSDADRRVYSPGRE